MIDSLDTIVYGSIIAVTVIPVIIKKIIASRNSRVIAVYEEPKAALPQTLYPTSEMNEVMSKLFDEYIAIDIITGPAGTGKSWFIQYFQELNKHISVIVAPTGVAALNVGGQTIHSFFHFPPEILNKSEIKKSKNPKIYQEILFLIIDEISMMRPDILDSVDMFLRVNRNNIEEPFGGVKIIMSGDLGQLPPVAKGFERERLLERYRTEYFFSAEVFKECLNNKSIQIHTFNKILRQRDKNYMSILNNLRECNLTQEVSKKLDDRLIVDIDEAPRDSIILTMTNAVAYKHNELELQKIKEELHEFHAVIEGDCKENDFPVDEVLKIKKGAKVLFVKNDDGGRWVNGTIGTVESFSEENIRGERSINVEIKNKIREVLPIEWKKEKYKLINGGIEKEEVGTFKQYPLKLGWAITVHKSQGSTFDNVIVDSMKSAFAPGQMYVALSRCRNLENLYLIGSVTGEDIIRNEPVDIFYNEMKKRKLM